MIIFFDIDGTVADASHRAHFLDEDPPNWPGFFDPMLLLQDPVMPEGAELAVRLARRYRHFIWWTGRPTWCRDATLEWLQVNGLPLGRTALFRVNPPPNLGWHDLEDRRPSPVVKRELALQYLDFVSRGTSQWEDAMFVDDSDDNLEAVKDLGLVMKATKAGMGAIRNPPFVRAPEQWRQNPDLYPFAVRDRLFIDPEGNVLILKARTHIDAAYAFVHKQRWATSPTARMAAVRMGGPGPHKKAALNEMLIRGFVRAGSDFNALGFEAWSIDYLTPDVVFTITRMMHDEGLGEVSVDLTSTKTTVTIGATGEVGRQERWGYSQP